MVVPQKQTTGKGERIAKRMAASGLCSRRDAEKLILDGKVKVNGVKITTPATLVNDDDDIVVVGKKLAPASKIRVFKFHKPVGLVTTARDEKGRETVFSGLPKNLPRLVSVGRLDLNSEGLLLLTTDGGLARYLELPARGLARTYRVRVFGKIEPERLQNLQHGINVNGVKYGPIEVEVGKSQASNTWLKVTLAEGKNREIRKVMAHLGLQVNRLIRDSFGPFALDDLPKGALVEVGMTFLKKNLPDYFASADK